MRFFSRWLRPRSSGAVSSERELRDRVEALEAALEELRRERDDLRSRLQARAQAPVEPPAAGDVRAAVNAASAMRERCAEVVRAAMPGERSDDQTYSRHALFDILDEVAREIDVLAPLEWGPRRPARSTTRLN